MKVKISLFSILFAAAAFNVSAQKITMDQAVSIALERNQKIKQYNERIEQKKFSEMESWGNFLPQINFVGSYNHLNKSINIDLEPIRQAMIQLQTGNQVTFATLQNPNLTPQQKAAVAAQASAALNAALPEFVSKLKSQDYKTGTFVGIQPLFLGGKLWAAKNAAKDEKIAAEIELKKTKDEIIQETVNNYLSVVLMTDILKTRKNVLAGIVRHRVQAEKLLREGLIANFNLLKARVAEAEAERNLYDDQNKLSVAYLALQNSMDVTDPVEVNDSLVYKSLSDSLTIYVEKAMNNNSMLKLISIKKDAVEQKYIADRSNFLPQLAAFGKYEIYPEYLSILEPRWVVGLNLSFNLFNGFKDYSKIQGTIHMQDELKFLEADVKSKIGLLVNKTYRDILNAKDRYKRLDATVSLADENLRSNEKRFETGLGTSLEVIDARLSYEKIQIDRKVVLYDYYKAINELLQASGEPENVLSIWNKKGELKMAVSKTKIVLAIPVIIALVSVYALVSKASSEKELIITGIVESTDVDVASKIPGRVDSILVSEGQQVKKGEILAYLESKEMDAKVAQAQSMVEAAKSRFDMAKNGARPEEKEAVQKLYAQSKHQFELAEKTYKRFSNLYRDSLISAQEKDQVEFQYKASKEQMEAAKAKYDMVLKGARVEEIAGAEALFHQAENGLREAMAYQQELTIKAPMTGELSKKIVDPGEVIASGYPIFTIINVSDSWVVLQLREDYMSKVKVGTVFKGIVTALGGIKADFEVSYIAPLGDFANWKPTNQKGDFDLKTFEVRLRPKGELNGLRPGMTVNIIF